MRQPFLIPSQPELDNKCPDCLCLQLTGSPVQGEKPSQPLGINLNDQPPQPEAEQIDLYLTIRFGTQRQHLGSGSITFGLKSGELKLRLKNATISSELQELAGSLELSLQPEQQASQEYPVPKNTEVSLSNLLLFLAGNKATVQETLVASPSLDSAEKFQFIPCQVTIKTSEEYPAWLFEEKMGEPALKGSLRNARLATLSVTAHPCHVEATFEVSKRDIRLIEVEGLWPANISRNKQAILERLIILRLLEPKFKPYLSRQELQFGKPIVIPEWLAGDSNGTKK